MSEEQLKEFIAKLAADSDLRDRLGQAQDPEAAAAIAREAGFAVSGEQLAALSSAAEPNEELSEEELESASGGLLGICLYTGNCIKATTGYRTLFAWDCKG